MHACRSTLEDPTTFLRAATTGEARALAEMSRWSWRRDAHRHFGNLPEDGQQKAVSPERLVAQANVRAFAGVARVRLIEHITVSELEEVVGVRTFGPGERVREHLFWMRWTSGRWLRVELAATVARLVRQIEAAETPDATDPASFREQYEWIVPQTGPKPAR